jgi:microtubule-associated protein, RP/EB family
LTAKTNATKTTKKRHSFSKEELLSWVNDQLGLNYNDIDQMWSGAAYCQLFHVLFPKLLNLDKVSGSYEYFFFVTERESKNSKV